MKSISFLVSHVLAITLLAGGLAVSHEYKAGDITIGHPYAFASIGSAKVGAGFLTLTNDGDTDDALIGVSSGFAARNEIHTHIRDNGRMMMRPVERIDIPAGATVRLEPGGLHLMLMGLKAPLRTGKGRPVVLTFEKAGDVTVELSIEDRNTGGGGHKHD